MVSLQRTFPLLTPDGVPPIPRLRWIPPPSQRTSGCSTVAPQWDETIVPWRISAACKLCFTEEELHGPPLEEIDPGFCCRCKKLKAALCSSAQNEQGGCKKCCCGKKRGGCACRIVTQDVCTCGPIEINVECERAMRAAKAAVGAAERRRWQPSASSRTMRFPSTQNAAPLPVAARENAIRVPLNPRLRPATQSGFHSFPNRFCCSLWCVGPPVLGGGNTY